MHVTLISSLPRLHLSSKDVLPPASIWTDSWVAMRSVMKVKSFQIIVLQGIIGSLPWTAIVFFTMWFELIGRTKTLIIIFYIKLIAVLRN
jgi:hypothetical protein